jgi:YD repeat-containing protein
VTLDYDGEGNLVSIEIIDASRRVTDTRSIEFELPE